MTKPPPWWLTPALQTELDTRHETVDKALARGHTLPRRSNECCPYAISVSCVCSESYVCLTHGSHCHGTHD